MSQSKKIYRAVIAAICMVTMLFVSHAGAVTAHAASSYGFVLLNSYSKTMKIGDEAYLIAVTSTGKKPTFSSSDRAVASVNTYGKITAKKAGTAILTAKIRNGEASCKVTVLKTSIQLSAKSISMENGETQRLEATASTGHAPKFKSSKSSIASVDGNGVILAKKPGSATITVTVDKTSATCKVTVRQPKVTLSRNTASLYRKGRIKLSVSSTSKSTPKWKSNKKSVATVDNNGWVTAVKNGRATITVTVDNVSKACEITVKKPEIRFGKDSVSLQVGQSFHAKVTVSSKNKPEYSSSNTNVASVDEHGKITAKSKGRAYIYAKEDGTKERMTVTVTEK
ncbi:MAG: hypothetical protein HFH38_12815 [Lachnospiraceae bacterium]|jgi:uncharacterized protein YjdB|nr:hypothetical protein [Lachnospiraceae bacterium]